jgi:hypothetical protein
LPIVQSAPPTIAADPHHLTKGIGCGIVGFLLLALVFAAVMMALGEARRTQRGLFARAWGRRILQNSGVESSRMVT